MNKVLPIIDLHTAIQGEGRDAGTPIILIRFTGCNLRCEFKDSICDTPYSSHHAEKGKYTLSDIRDFLSKHDSIKYVMITGGNPTLHPEILQDILYLCKEYDKFTAIEDNGTQFKILRKLDFVVLSPKLSNSDPKVKGKIRENHIKARSNINSLRNWNDHYDCIFKFVVSDPTDMAEITDLVADVGACKSSLYLMPEGITAEQLNEKRSMVMDLALRYRYNYSDRLHIMAYGNERNK